MKKVFFWMVAMAFVLTSCSNEQPVLSLRLNKGETYLQHSKLSLQMSQEFLGQKMSTTMNVIGDISYKVTDVSEDIYTFETNYQNLTLETVTPQGTFTFSSKEDDASNPMTGMMHKMLQALTSESFIVQMDDKGKVKEIKGLDVLLNKMVDSVEELPEAQKEQVKKEMESSFGAASFKGNIEMASAIFPEQAVGENEYWNVETNLQVINSNVAARYHVVEVGSDYVIIEGNADITKESMEETPTFKGTQAQLDVEGTMTARIKIDKKTGWTKEATFIQDLKGDILMSADPNAEDQMKMPMEMHQEIFITDSAE